MLAIFKREFKSYFTNMTGYVIIALMLVFSGIFSMILNLIGQYASYEYVLTNQSIVLIVAIPILTMRSIAEDRKSKTDMLLYSLPLKMSSIVLGKYLAMLAVWGITCACMGITPIILSGYGEVDFVATYSAIFGFFLMGASLIAICMFFSSLTENQLISALVGVGVMLALYLMSALIGILPSTALASFIAFIIVALVLALVVFLLSKNYLVALIVLAIAVVPLAVVYAVNSELLAGAFPTIASKLSLFDRFYSFVDGAFDITAVVYYVSITVFFVYLSVQSLDKRRWS